MFALQLAKLAGYKTVSTCSPRNFALIQSLGADVVVDVSTCFELRDTVQQIVAYLTLMMQYNDPEVSKKIAEATGNTIHKALDSISDALSENNTLQALAPGPGKIVVLSLASEVVSRDDVLIQRTYTIS